MMVKDLMLDLEKGSRIKEHLTKKEEKISNVPFIFRYTPTAQSRAQSMAQSMAQPMMYYSANITNGGY